MKSFDYESRISDIAYNIQKKYHLNDDYYGDHYPNEIRVFENQLNSLDEKSEYADDIFKKINHLFENYAINSLESDKSLVINCQSSRKDKNYNVIILEEQTDYYIHDLKTGEIKTIDGNRDGLTDFFDLLTADGVDRLEYLTNPTEAKEVVNYALNDMIDSRIGYDKKSVLTLYATELLNTGQVDMVKYDELAKKQLRKLAGFKDPSKPKRVVIKDWSVNNPQVEKEILKRLEKYPLYSQDNENILDSKIALHIFGGPYDYYITEGEKVGNDIEMFGWCNLGNDQLAELGYVMLSEIKTIEDVSRKNFIPIELEKNCIYKTLGDVAQRSNSLGLERFLEKDKVMFDNNDMSRDSKTTSKLEDLINIGDKEK